jgi:hypothetical protein
LEYFGHTATPNAFADFVSVVDDVPAVLTHGVVCSTTSRI